MCMTELQHTDLVEQLEKIVDKRGLIHVITALDLMCNGKAEHIRANWQDKNLAAKWSEAAYQFYTIAQWAAESGLE